MKYSKFTDSQIIDALKRVDAGQVVPDVCQEPWICTTTFYKRCDKCGGMDTSIIGRMRQLEEEKYRFKKKYIEEKLKVEIANYEIRKRGGASPRREIAQKGVSEYIKLIINLHHFEREQSINVLRLIRMRGTRKLPTG